MVRQPLGLSFLVGVVSLCWCLDVGRAIGQQQTKGAYVLVDIRRDFSEFDKDPDMYRVLSASDNHCKVAITGVHQGRWVCSRIMLHTWNTPPAVLQPGSTINFDLLVANRLLKAEWDMHIGDRTAIRIDTDIGGPLWSNTMVGVHREVALGSFRQLPSQAVGTVERVARDAGRLAAFLPS